MVSNINILFLDKFVNACCGFFYDLLSVLILTIETIRNLMF